ncbi:hypothetical protein LTR84_000420 [Exophiala bonariae]|uniref:Aldehyde dehydrogenase domain-containing protein n=1 Tax=Exophiala bonariae TaxID=1690606 RepID=A0AAV9NQV9_9EURO|nr:hypothetical protein LTR84_000420 [Exophiala bonariae]
MGENCDETLGRVKLAAIDGRMRILRFRQLQFQNLYQYLIQNRDVFIEATQFDDGCTKEEAEIEFASALIDLRNHYDALDLTTDLEQEYRVSKGQCNEAHKVAIGIVYIIPDTISALFGVLSALCAAIQAGSCCILEMENTTRKTSVLLRQIFSESMNKDAFGVVLSRASPPLLLQCVVVDQARKLRTTDDSKPCRVLTSPATPNVALVDRTADVELAAKEVVASRLAFDARGRYAVDAVFVNEFVADALATAVVQAAQKYFGQHKIAGSQRSTRYLSSKSDISDIALLENEVRLGRAKVVHSDSGMTVVEVLERSSALVNTKVSSRTVILIRSTSLDDFIDVLDNGSSQLSVGALFVFAGPREAKYLAQHIFSQVTIVNHIPAQLLVGPTTPIGYPVSLRTRYSASMFEYPSPQFAVGPRSHLASRILAGPTKSAWLMGIAQKPLKPTGQPPPGAWGFFEQGMVIGALVYLLPILSVSLFGAGYASIWGYRKFTIRS